MAQDLCLQHAKNESQINDLRVQQQQHDSELRQIFENIAGIESKMMFLISEFGRFEKSMLSRLDRLEKEQSNQRVADAKQDGKINFLWTFLVEKNGLILIGIMAYLVLGKT